MLAKQRLESIVGDPLAFNGAAMAAATCFSPITVYFFSFEPRSFKSSSLLCLFETFLL